MKIIGSVKEDLALEKRISITPKTVKKLIDLNFSVFLEKNYGDHLGIVDEEYATNGASFLGSAKEVLEKSEIVLKVNCPSDHEINHIKEKSILYLVVKKHIISPICFYFLEYIFYCS